MKPDRITELEEKYWLAETDSAEEAELKAWYRDQPESGEADAAAQWFGFLAQRQQIRYQGALPALPAEKVEFKRIPLFRQTWLRVAAVFLLMAGAAWMFRQYQYREEQRILAARWTDTFEDPDEALAEMQKVLGNVSAKMNEGLDVTGQELLKAGAFDDILN